MDPPPVRSPRKELQGPRPAPLKIHKDSHKIRKPPVAPAPGGPQGHTLPPLPRQPVIIYTVSPKIIHTKPSDFMNLVQRLTGLSSSVAAPTTNTAVSSSSSVAIINNNNNPSFFDGQYGGGAVSPAARYAAIEKANNDNVKGFGNDHHATMINTIAASSSSGGVVGLGFDQNFDINNNRSFFSGILSPGPGSLPPISPSFFSPPSDAFFHDLISPAVLGGGSGFTASPVGPSSSFFVSPRTHHLITSPTTPSFDHLFFNNIFSDHNL